MPSYDQLLTALQNYLGPAGSMVGNFLGSPAPPDQQFTAEQARQDPMGTIQKHDPLAGFLGPMAGTAMDAQFYPQIDTYLGKITKYLRDAYKGSKSIDPMTEETLNVFARHLRSLQEATKKQVGEYATSSEAPPEYRLTPEQRRYVGGETGKGWPEPTAQQLQDLPSVAEFSPGSTYPTFGAAQWHGDVRGVPLLESEASIHDPLAKSRFPSGERSQLPTTGNWLSDQPRSPMDPEAKFFGPHAGNRVQQVDFYTPSRLQWMFDRINQMIGGQ